ncbi:MAG TPA: ankyrin repeat domain-containing protein [Rhabdochlamydiaceae bacterium]|nr:ankyrin repeat domain-containing protein [Rhabdochlamydiaceae bacterium]
MVSQLNLNKSNPPFQTSVRVHAMQEAGILSAIKALNGLKDLQASDRRYIDLCQRILQLKKPLKEETLKAVIVVFDKLKLKKNLFFFCIRNGIGELAKQLLQSGVPVDTKDENGRTALVAACNTDSPSKEVIRLLVDKGADIYAKTEDLEKPLLEIMARKNKIDMVALLLKCSEEEAQKFADHFNSRFWSGHVNSMKGITFKGSIRFDTAYLMKKILETLPEPVSKQIHSYYKNKLIRAFLEGSKEIKNMHKTSLSIHKGDLVIVPAGYDSHCIFFVFYQGYLAICNRNSRYTENNAFEVYKIDSTKMNLSIITRLLNYKTKKGRVAANYFYKILPKLLSPVQHPIKDEICKLIEQLLTPCKQKIGNCSYVGAKLALRAALALLHLRKEKGKWILKEEDVERSRYFSKSVSTHIRFLKLEEYYNEYGNSDLFDEDFVEDALEIALKHKEKTPEVSLDDYPNIKEYLE